ncbi:hypothetical protein [Streptomyces sp. NPDC101455]|uniref:hypothetical protein n=1 Tax=Streptomyces sp. NPDC101455 TaxID=3366142 RepID=UPI0037F88A9C
MRTARPCILIGCGSYITWDDYLANEAKLKANCTRDGARPPREGLGPLRAPATVHLDEDDEGRREA